MVKRSVVKASHKNGNSLPIEFFNGTMPTLIRFDSCSTILSLNVAQDACHAVILHGSRDYMHVVGHKAVSVDYQFVFRCILDQPVKIVMTIRFREKDILTLVTSLCNMVRYSRYYYSRNSRHIDTIVTTM